MEGNEATPSNIFAPPFWSQTTPTAMRMMQKMGYKPGSGLGKLEQGIRETIKVSSNLGKRGLGLTLGGLNLSDELWEEICVEERVHWLDNKWEGSLMMEVKEGANGDVIEDDSFCEGEVLRKVFKAKEIFDELDINELNQARTRANPFETIRSVFFMNRAALKMANLDAACDFLFTNVQQEQDSPVYFSDVCAGPGGFTEYILWRKSWFYKGFGLTLKDEHDFKDSNCCSGVSFQPLYGLDQTGDVCNPDNLQDFTDRVINETGGLHFMMSDGGFCVDGQENLQEVLSKNIYLCQCLLALQTLRAGGHFVTKLFDVFTPFSVGLLFLMYLCFEKVGIIKPNSSRPANSERYFICNNLLINDQTNLIRQYLSNVAIRLWELKTLPDRDVLEIVPLRVIKEDEGFFRYIVDSNTRIAKKQTQALEKLACFCRNPHLEDPRQSHLRSACLKFWNIPDEKRKIDNYHVSDVLDRLNIAPEVLKVQPRHITSKTGLESLDPKHWHFAFLYSALSVNRTNFYAAVGSGKTYRLQNNRWVKVKDLQLVKGTFLFGEFVKESQLGEEGVAHRYSLHVIDACFLGEVDLQGCSFEERQKLIQIYCKSVNKESETCYSVRVRAKPLKRLNLFPHHLNLLTTEAEVDLPQLGFKTTRETHPVNSVLLLKTNKEQSFQSTHVLRVQIFQDFEDLSDVIKRIK